MVMCRGKREAEVDCFVCCLFRNLQQQQQQNSGASCDSRAPCDSGNGGDVFVFFCGIGLTSCSAMQAGTTTIL